MIKDAKRGLVLFEPGTSRIEFYHKIKCDPRNRLAWVGLTDFLEMLRHNTEMKGRST